MSETPFDWSDILEWSILNTAADPSGEQDEPAHEMTESDRQFLLDAMDNSVMDEQKRIKVLLHTLRLPEDPYVLYQMEQLAGGKQLSVVEQKQQLRSLLDMRKEDQWRSRLGLPTLANEAIPTDVIGLDEAFKLRKLGEQRAASPADSEPTSEPTKEQAGEDTTEGDNSEEQESTPKAPPQPKTISESITTSQDELEQALQQIPAPTVEQLKKVYNSVRDHKLDALDEIHDRIGRADNSIGFVTFNGLPVLKRCIQSNDFEISSGALLVFGDVIQNQPRCQRAAMKAGFLPLLLEIANPLYYIPHLEHYNAQQKAKEACGGVVPEPTIDDFARHQYSHFGHYYPKFIIQRMRSALFAISVLLSNYSKAQVSFVFFKGLQLVTHYLEIGYLLASRQQQQQQQQQQQHPTIPPSITVLLDYLDQHAKSFSTCLRRVFSIITYIIDPSYDIKIDQPSSDILQAMDATPVRITASSQTTTGETGNNTEEAWESYLTHFRNEQSRSEEIELIRQTAPFMVQKNQIHPSFFLDDNRSHREEDTFPLHSITTQHVLQLLSVTYYSYLINHPETSVREEFLLTLQLLTKVPGYLPSIVQSYRRDVLNVVDPSSVSCDDSEAYQYVTQILDYRVLTIIKLCKADPSLKADFGPELKLIADIKNAFKQAK